MRGSCVKKSLLPKGVQASLSDPTATSTVLAADPFCVGGNHTAPPTPAPAPAKSKSYSVMAIVIALCCTVLGLVVFFMAFVGWRSIQLANWFEDRRIKYMNHRENPLLKPDEEQDENPVSLTRPPDAVSESQLLMTNPVEDLDRLTSTEAVAVAFKGVGYRVGATGIFGPITGVIRPGQMVCRRYQIQRQLSSSYVAGKCAWTFRRWKIEFSGYLGRQGEGLISMRACIC